MPPNANADINLEGFLLPVSNESYFHPLSPTFSKKNMVCVPEGKGGREGSAAISQSISQKFDKSIDQNSIKVYSIQFCYHAAATTESTMKHTNFQPVASVG